MLTAPLTAGATSVIIDRSSATIPPDADLEALAQRVGAVRVPLENPCVEQSAEGCTRFALDRTFAAFDRLLTGDKRPVTVLQLGDSHIAADYVTSTVRRHLQRRFGDAGRGFVHADQRDGYGGRRIGQRSGWRRRRAVDPGENGGRFGFAAVMLEVTQPKASLLYQLQDDLQITVYFDGGPKTSEIELSLEGELLGRVDTRKDSQRTDLKTILVPVREQKTAKDQRAVQVHAGAGTRLIGFGFTTGRPGILWDSNGPVGIDAKTYLAMSEESFREHLRLADPKLVVYMLGGNDALRVRQKRGTMEETRADFAALIERTRAALPGSDCMLWGPMDAGEKRGNKIVSKALVKEMRDLLKEAARDGGCAFWDLYDAMGGQNSVARWAQEGIMNADLIHPRTRAGELLGDMFARELLSAYRGD